MNALRLGAASTAIATLLAACGGGTAAGTNPPQISTQRGTPTPQPSATCPPPVPGPRPYLSLAYPVPNATSVPVDIGELIFAGSYVGVTGNATVNVTTASGNTVPVGAYTAAPSPMPTPYATPSGWSGNVPFIAVPVPTLSPSTTYNVTYSYSDDGGPPPTCRFDFKASAGTFTTGS